MSFMDLVVIRCILTVAFAGTMEAKNSREGLGFKDRGEVELLTWSGDGVEDDPPSNDCKTSVPTSREVLGLGESNGSLDNEIGTEEHCSTDGEEGAVL
jgi:hypothetical protein